MTSPHTPTHFLWKGLNPTLNILIIEFVVHALSHDVNSSDEFTFFSLVRPRDILNKRYFSMQAITRHAKQSYSNNINT